MADEKKEGGLSFGSLLGGKKEDSKKAGGMGDIGGTFFAKHDMQPSFDTAEISNQINNLSRRLKMLEERYTSLRNKSQLGEQNTLESNKETIRNIKAGNSQFLELRRDFDDLRDKVKLIVKELKDTAKSEDVQLLEKYVNIWEPLNFVTKNDVERIVEDKVNDIMQNAQEEKSG